MVRTDAATSRNAAGARLAATRFEAPSCASLVSVTLVCSGAREHDHRHDLNEHSMIDMTRSCLVKFTMLW